VLHDVDWTSAEVRQVQVASAETSKIFGTKIIHYMWSRGASHMFKEKSAKSQHPACHAMHGHHYLMDHPQLLLPLAVIHVIPLALFIHGAFKYANLHEKRKLEQERTKQIKYRALPSRQK
jgi:hypothetical protein